MSRKRKTIRYSDEEWERAGRRAEAEGMHTSTYVREVSTGDLEAGSKRSRQKLVAGLFQVATLLKQLRNRYDAAARVARRGEGTKSDFEHDSAQVHQALAQARQTLDGLGAFRRMEAARNGSRARAGSRATPGDHATPAGDEGGAT